MKRKPRADRRTAYTKRVVREALFELLDEKGSFSAVSVTDLCQRADVNRSTFYLHYEDKFALLREIVSEALASDPTAAGVAEVPPCQRLPADGHVQRLFRDASLAPIIAACVLDANRDTAIPQLMERCGVDEEEALCLFTFMVNGSMAVNQALGWKDGELWEKTRACIAEFSNGGFNALAARKG